MDNHNVDNRGKVSRWESDEIIYSGFEHTESADISVVAEISHPVFDDGGVGEPRLNISVKRTPKRQDSREFVLRFMCPRGEVHEVEALDRLIEDLAGRMDDCKKKLQMRRGHWNDNRIQDHQRWQDEMNSHERQNKKGVGDGLSRFSNATRTKRVRDKKRNGEDDQQEV